MNKAEFLESIDKPVPPNGIHPLLESLWNDARGDWSKAHEIVQNLSGKAAARIHAYLHRKECDLINAKYWYMRAEQQMPEIEIDLEKEWNEIVDYIFEFTDTHSLLNYS